MWRHSWLGFPALKSTSEVNEIILHELPSRRKFILHWNVAEDGENAFLYNTFCALHFSSLLNFFTQTIWTPLWEIKCKTIYFCCSHFPTWLTRTLPSWKTNFQTREVGASKEHLNAASETPYLFLISNICHVLLFHHVHLQLVQLLLLQRFLWRCFTIRAFNSLNKERLWLWGS